MSPSVEDKDNLDQITNSEPTNEFEIIKQKIIAQILPLKYSKFWSKKNPKELKVFLFFSKMN